MKGKDPYYPTQVSGINPKTKKKERYNFRGTDDGFEQGCEKAEALEKQGYTEVSHSGQTHLNRVMGW
tara:strand:+ start:1348 stop:1548 length:201 start_codon:yes stop_codon:yes gene_type:complete